MTGWRGVGTKPPVGLVVCLYLNNHELKNKRFDNSMRVTGYWSPTENKWHLDGLTGGHPITVIAWAPLENIPSIGAITDFVTDL